MIFLYESDVICSTSTRKEEIGTSPSKIHHMEFSKHTNDPQSTTEDHRKPAKAPTEHHAKRLRRKAEEQHPASTTTGPSLKNARSQEFTTIMTNLTSKLICTYAILSDCGRLGPVSLEGGSMKGGWTAYRSPGAAAIKKYFYGVESSFDNYYFKDIP